MPENLTRQIAKLNTSNCENRHVELMNSTRYVCNLATGRLNLTRIEAQLIQGEKQLIWVFPKQILADR